MLRRTFLQLPAAALAAASSKRYRAAVIGCTGCGNYGHGLDTVWSAFDNVEVVAVADSDADGLAAAKQRLGVKRAYSDYHKMLSDEKPDLVSIGPRWLDRRVEMVEAAAEAGAHIYLEKAFAKDLSDADRMVAAIRRAGIKVQLAHQMRMSPYTQRVVRMIKDGEIGVIQEVRGRGKEDSRAGGEDLMVLGSHILDVMRMILGNPSWVFSHVTEQGREMNPHKLGAPREPIGPISGREMAAMYAFDGGVHGYFSSKQNDQTHPWRFGTHVYGSRGVIFLPNAIYPGGLPYILRSPAWVPDDKHAWEPIEAQPEPPFPGAEERQLANALMVRDLIEAIEQDRKPVCSETDGLWTVEMIVGLYQSQVKGAPMTFPLKDRAHPLSA